MGGHLHCKQISNTQVSNYWLIQSVVAEMFHFKYLKFKLEDDPISRDIPHLIFLGRLPLEVIFIGPICLCFKCRKDPISGYQNIQFSNFRDGTGWLRRLCCLVAEAMWLVVEAMWRGCGGYVVGNYSDNNATLWPYLAS
jgi:hypothetical protein